MKKSILLIFLLAFFSNLVIAVPADPSPKRTVTKDGRTLTFICIGDEFFQTYQTLDEYTIIRTEENDWVYGILDNDKNLVPSNVIACNEEERTTEEVSFLASVQKNLFFKREQLAAQIENRTKFTGSLKSGKSTKSSMNAFPTEGTVNLLIILVDFPDRKMSYRSEVWQDFATGDNYRGNGNNEYTQTHKFGSIRNYYLENSNNRLDLQIDVIGPYTVSKNRSEYGKNIYGITGNRIGDYNPVGMAKEAVNLAIEDGIDFTKYDNDNNDTIDAIHFIFAGHSEASTLIDEDIWPMRSNFHGSGIPRPNGKRVDIYSISSEFQGTTSYMAGVGVTCHELTHVLGLPDWYDTDESDGKNYAMGQYSLMDMGPYLNNENTPPHLNAIEREMLNWHNHIELDTAGIYTLPIWNTDGTAISYKLTTPVEHEYYILENRQQAGWDNLIPGHGMLIYHVDQKMVNVWYEGPNAIRNSINARRDSMGCYIICADNHRSEARYSMRGDPFPGTSGNTSFTDASTPAVDLRYTNGPLNKPITQITELTDSVIQFIFNYNTVSLPTGIACSDDINEIAPLTAGTYNENDTYLWQVLKNDAWVDADEPNTNSEYILQEYVEGLRFRRILYPADGSTQNVSAAYALPGYDIPSGGVITPSNSSIPTANPVTLTLSDYSGNIADWQTKISDTEEWKSLQKNEASLNILIDTAGTHTYRAVVKKGKCPDVYSSEAIVIAVGESITLKDYSIYPSPSFGNTISIYTSADDFYDVSIFNSIGKRVYYNTDVQLNSTRTINLSGIQSGVYIVQIKNKQDNSIHNRKIIITK